ncbi:MAG: lipopolysaccharide transport periplasmic protein LptA [Pseudomonadota bacterium]
MALPSVTLAQSIAFGGIANAPDAPVEITADALSLNQEAGTAQFNGNVVIGQGTLRLSAARVDVFYKAGAQEIDRMEATGGVTLVNGEDAAEARRADYNLSKQQLIMRGDVLVTQGPNALMAEEMILNLETGQAQMQGRVRTILNASQN